MTPSLSGLIRWLFDFCKKFASGCYEKFVTFVDSVKTLLSIIFSTNHLVIYILSIILGIYFPIENTLRDSLALGGIIIALVALITREPSNLKYLDLIRRKEIIKIRMNILKKVLASSILIIALTTIKDPYGSVFIYATSVMIITFFLEFANYIKKQHIFFEDPLTLVEDSKKALTNENGLKNYKYFSGPLDTLAKILKNAPAEGDNTLFREALYALLGGLRYHLLNDSKFTWHFRSYLEHILVNLDKQSQIDFLDTFLRETFDSIYREGQELKDEQLKELANTFERLLNILHQFGVPGNKLVGYIDSSLSGAQKYKKYNRIVLEKIFNPGLSGRWGLDHKTLMRLFGNKI